MKLNLILISTLICFLISTSICFSQDSKTKPNEQDKPKTRAQQINEEKDELKAEYELILQKQKNKLSELEMELNRLSMENKLAIERQQAELRQIKDEIEKLSLQNKLADEKLKAITAAQSDELAKISLENKLASELNKKALMEISKQLEKIKLENELKSEKNKTLDLERAKEKADIDLEIRRMELKERQMKFEKSVMDARMDKLTSDLALRAKKEEWKKESNTEPVYTDKPFQNNQLIISDRRIALNGPILMKTADYVTERIHYFNNISTAPIFIVIDRSPGGSVMAGYRIVKAMQASKAPVHVVVKSYAASMAAIITTLADKSYVYPNAILLHHQMSTVNWGNMTQLKEQLELAREWERRLLAPVAKKMGIDQETFRKKMYEKNSDGDWQEFGDKAVDYKWATAVVDRIEETGFVKNPDYENPYPSKPLQIDLEEKVTEKGERYVILPRLEPFDFYFIYNPDNYYR